MTVSVRVTVPAVGASRRRTPLGTPPTPVVDHVKLIATPAGAAQITATGSCAGGLCTVQIAAPSGGETFVAQLFDASNNLMFAGTAAATIVADQDNVVAIVPGHVISTLTAALTASSLTAGVSGSTTLAITATDAAGAAITSGAIADASGNLGGVSLAVTSSAPTVSGGNSAGTVTPGSASITDASKLASVPVSYDGRALINATITATANGAAPVSASAALAVTPALYEYAGVGAARDGKAGPDGKLWLGQTGGSQVTAIAPPAPGATTVSGTTYSFPASFSGGGFGIAFSNDGQLWSTNWSNAIVHCQFPPVSQAAFTSSCVTQSTPFGDHSSSLALGSDGLIYETESYYNPSQTQLNGTMTAISGGGGGEILRPGSDNRLWYAGGQYSCYPCGHPYIVAITPGAVPSVARYASPGASNNVTNVAPGLDGNIWYVSSIDNMVGKMGSDGSNPMYFLLPTASAQPSVITAGADGVYVGYNAASAIARVPYTATKTGDVVEYPTSAAVSGTIFTGPDGNIYVTLSNNKLAKLAI